MTIKLTHKLLENKRQGRKLNIDESAKKLSIIKGLKQGGNKKIDQDDEKMSEDEQLEQKKVQKAKLGPPGFYEADLTRYLKKFEKTVQNRQEFKHRMRHKMNFTDTSWNDNVYNASKGERKNRGQNAFIVPSGSTVNLQTYIKNDQSAKKERPPSRGSLRAHSTLDFDWYGNARDIQHLTKTKPETCVDHIRFETSLRNYPSNTSFKAAKPWVINPSEMPLKEEVLASQQQLTDLGYAQNVGYSSVSRLDPTMDCRGKLPDHLMLPRYSDEFIAGQNPSLVRDLSVKQVDRSINNLKWQLGLRDSIGQIERIRIKEKSSKKKVARSYSSQKFRTIMQKANNKNSMY